jgi:hypothetical protein
MITKEEYKERMQKGKILQGMNMKLKQSIKER